MNDAEICEKLKDLVKAFNEGLTEWYEESGCVAGFCWKYHDGEGRAIKELEVESVDRIMFRKPPPGFEALREAMGIAKG